MPWSIERSYFPSLIERGETFVAYVYDGYWIDIGTPEKYTQVHRDIMDGRFSAAPFAERVRLAHGRRRRRAHRGRRDDRGALLHRRGRAHQGRRAHRPVLGDRPADADRRGRRRSTAPSSGPTAASAATPSSATPSSAATATSGATCPSTAARCSATRRTLTDFTQRHDAHQSPASSRPTTSAASTRRDQRGPSPARSAAASPRI